MSLNYFVQVSTTQAGSVESGGVKAERFYEGAPLPFGPHRVRLGGRCLDGLSLGHAQTLLR